MKAAPQVTFTYISLAIKNIFIVMIGFERTVKKRVSDSHTRISFLRLDLASWRVLNQVGEAFVDEKIRVGSTTSLCHKFI